MYKSINGLYCPRFSTHHAVSLLKHQSVNVIFCIYPIHSSTVYDPAVHRQPSDAGVGTRRAELKLSDSWVPRVHWQINLFFACVYFVCNHGLFCRLRLARDYSLCKQLIYVYVWGKQYASMRIILFRTHLTSELHHQWLRVPVSLNVLNVDVRAHTIWQVCTLSNA